MVQRTESRLKLGRPSPRGRKENLPKPLPPRPSTTLFGWHVEEEGEHTCTINHEPWSNERLRSKEVAWVGNNGANGVEAVYALDEVSRGS